MEKDTDVAAKTPPVRIIKSIANGVSGFIKGSQDAAIKFRKIGQAGASSAVSASIIAADKASKGVELGVYGAEKTIDAAKYARSLPGYASNKIMKLVLDDSPTSFSEYLSKQAKVLANVPTFYKLSFLICFYFFFYKIFYDIGIFFGLNNVELILYMAWFGMLLFFISFMKPSRSRLY
jgi:hypothetical protein